MLIRSIRRHVAVAHDGRDDSGEGRPGAESEPTGEAGLHVSATARGR